MTRIASCSGLTIFFSFLDSAAFVKAKINNSGILALGMFQYSARSPLTHEELRLHSDSPTRCKSVVWSCSRHSAIERHRPYRPGSQGWRLHHLRRLKFSHSILGCVFIMQYVGKYPVVIPWCNAEPVEFRTLIHCRYIVKYCTTVWSRWTFSHSPLRLVQASREYILKPCFIVVLWLSGFILG